MKACLLLLVQLCVHALSEDSNNATCGDRCCNNYYQDKYNESCVDGDDNTWKYAAFTLVGYITTMVVVGLMMLMKSFVAKRELLESNQYETENLEEEHIYERRRSLQSTVEVENEQQNNQADESNYTNLKPSSLFPIFDNPKECNPGPNSNTTSVDATKFLALWDLSIDEEDDSSDEQESEDEGYGHLFKHEMYNVLSLRRTYPDNSIHVRPVSDDTMLNISFKETEDGYQSIQLATSKIARNKVESSKIVSRRLSEKATIRQSLISETIEEYMQTSKVIQNRNVLEDEQQDLIMADRKSQTEGTEIDQPSQTNTRPYSLAKISWSSDLTQDKIPIAESIIEDYDEN